MTIFDHLANTLRLPREAKPAPGLRAAQLGAIHTVCGHFWEGTTPAIVVMPTGSGKTAVMMAAMILLRPTRALIVAPSRLLRDQLRDDFSELKPLKAATAVQGNATSPKVRGVGKRLSKKSLWDSLRKSDVVVGTPATLSPAISGVAQPPMDLFDLVIFDEAHHVPAPTYTAIADAFPWARKLLLTATPFRRDERKIPGEVVFTYDIAQARRDGIFGALKYMPVEPAPGQTADEAIAMAAAAQLQRDRGKGLDHVLVVRASGRDRADELAVVYQKVAPTLKLQRLHSGLGTKFIAKTIEQLRRRDIDGVIAVDMLGEGFDLANLKVAALHSPHRSLAITLQFIGRFARTTAPNLGEATFFAVRKDIEHEAATLYSPGAEWNEIVEDLSRQRMQSEKEVRESIGSFDIQPTVPIATSESSERQAARLWSLRPYFHAKVYEVTGSVDLGGELKLPGHLEPILVRRSKKEDATIWVARETTPLRWSTADDWYDVRYDMFLVAHVPDKNLLFICTTRRENAVYDALVEVVAKNYRRIAPGEINRVLRNIDNPEFFSVGLRNRAGGGGAGAESYRMLTGPSADKALRATDGVLYDQGHAFCRGVEKGGAVTIGFSSGSKVWTNRWDQVPKLLEWLRAIATKIHDSRARPQTSMFDRLGTADRIQALPAKIVAADLPAEAYMRESSFVQCPTGSAFLVDCRVDLVAQAASSVDFVLRSGSLTLSFNYNLGRRQMIIPTDAQASAATIGSGIGRVVPLAEFLKENPPLFYTETLDQVVGEFLTKAPGRLAETLSGQIEAVDWSAANTDPFTEKPPAPAGKLSLFEYVERRMQGERVDVLFADDASNEIADYVAVRVSPRQTTVQLVHCKAATRVGRSPTVPNKRVEELFEVVGQAVKCRRWLNTRRLLAQVKHRLANTQGSRFVVGDMPNLERLLADASKAAFEVVIVQPALSASPKETIADLILAADAYQRGGGVLPIRLWGTAPP